MTIQEKDKLVQEFITTLLATVNEKNPIAGGISTMLAINNMVEQIYQLGKIEGFKEGFAEAIRKLERKQSKLN